MICTNFIAKWIIRIASKFTPGTLSVTIWPFIFISPEFYQFDIRLIKHERYHLKQWLRYWWFGFIFVYLWQFFTVGYAKMRLECEAREAEKGQ